MSVKGTATLPSKEVQASNEDTTKIVNIPDANLKNALNEKIAADTKTNKAASKDIVYLDLHNL